MKVGLIRHYKVVKGLPDRFLVSPEELVRWFEEYDGADIAVVDTDMGGVAWQKCFTSDLPRAVKTAAHVYTGEVVTLAQLREIRALPPVNLRLPMVLWALLIKLAWLTDHRSQPESRGAIAKRIGEALDQILNQTQESVLIVSHGGVMEHLQQQLLHRGFRGPGFRTPKNGKLYIFEKQ